MKLQCPRCGNKTFEIDAPDGFVAYDQIESIICTYCDKDIDDTFITEIN